MKTKLLKKLREQVGRECYSLHLSRDGSIVLITKESSALFFKNKKDLAVYLRAKWHSVAFRYLNNHSTKIRKRKKHFLYIW